MIFFLHCLHCTNICRREIFRSTADLRFLQVTQHSFSKSPPPRFFLRRITQTLDPKLSPWTKKYLEPWVQFLLEGNKDMFYNGPDRVRTCDPKLFSVGRAFTWWNLLMLSLKRLLKHYNLKSFIIILKENPVVHNTKRLWNFDFFLW